MQQALDDEGAMGVKHMPGELWAMADSSWADVKPAKKSTLSNMLFMNNAVFSWRNA
jgi:hypothetical protein